MPVQSDSDAKNTETVSNNGSGTGTARTEEDLEAIQADVDRIVDAAADEARRLGQHAMEYGADFADRQKRGLADSIADVADNLREAAHSLDERPNVQAILGQASEALEDISYRVRNTTFTDLYESAEDYARSHPLLVAAGAAFAGLAIARFVKSSSERSYGRQRFSSYRDAGHGYRGM